MAKAPYKKPDSEKAKENQRQARFNAAAMRIWEAGLADMKRRVPQGRGVESYDRWAKLRLAEALDRFSDIMLEWAAP
jgi:hypothetical protein